MPTNLDVAKQLYRTQMDMAETDPEGAMNIDHGQIMSVVNNLSIDEKVAYSQFINDYAREVDARTNPVVAGAFEKAIQAYTDDMVSRATEGKRLYDDAERSAFIAPLTQMEIQVIFATIVQDGKRIVLDAIKKSGKPFLYPNTFVRDTDFSVEPDALRDAKIALLHGVFGEATERFEPGDISLVANKLDVADRGKFLMFGVSLVADQARDIDLAA
jgi:hypothetical protein